MVTLTEKHQQRLRACAIDDSAYQNILDIVQEITATEGTKYLPTEQLHQSVIGAMREGVVFHGVDGAIQSCNAAAESILGLTADQLMGLKSVDPRWCAIHEDGSPFPGEIHPAMITLQTGVALNDIIMGINKPDGTLTWISISSQPLLTPGKQTLIGAVVTFTDITEQKLKTRVQDAQQAELAAMYENIPIMMLLVDAQRRVRKINRTTTQVLNTTEEQLIGLVGGDALHCVHAHDVEAGCGYGPACRTCAIRNTVLNTLEKGKSYHQVETEAHLTISEQPLQVLISTSLIELDGEKNVLVCLEDVSALKQSQKQAFQLAIEQERIQMLSSFIRDTTHEFRTPLAVINTKTHLLEKMTDPLKQQRHLEGIKKQTANLMNLVDNLLLLARLDISDLQESKTFDVNICIEEAVTTKDAFFGRHGTRCALELCTHPLLIHGDPREIQLMLTHILDNAARFSKGNNMIYITSFHEDDQIIVSISDNGMGIAAEHLPHVLDRFYRVDESHSISGYGLGLAIVSKIVERHQGTIWLESEEKVGTTVHLAFPLNPIEQPQKPEFSQA